MKKNKNKRNIKEDEFVHLFNHKYLNIKRKKIKSVRHSLIYLISIFIIIIFLISFIIIKIKNNSLKRTMHYNSNTTILLVGIAKYENNYIREWIEYHKGIGINKIILCDNNPING